MDKIVQVAKARGFVYPGSEIYGGLANTWDYGNLGVELKNNVKRAWWKKFIQENPYNVGVDCAILMNPQTWVASGHLGGFSDPLMDCKECHERFRADKLIEDFAQENNIELDGSVDGWSNEKMVDFIESHNIPCPSCGKHNFTDIRQFNLMFKTFQGVTEDAKNTVYLRPETAQGICRGYITDGSFYFYICISTDYNHFVAGVIQKCAALTRFDLSVFYGCKRSVKRIPCGQCFCNTSRIQFHIIKFLIIFGCTVRNGKRCLFFSCVEFFQRNASLSVFLIIGIYFIFDIFFQSVFIICLFVKIFHIGRHDFSIFQYKNCAFIRFVRSAATGKHSYAKQ